MSDITKYLAYDLSEDKKSKAYKLLKKSLRNIKNDNLIENTCKNPYEVKKMALLSNSDYEDYYSLLSNEKTKKAVAVQLIAAITTAYVEISKIPDMIDNERTAMFENLWGLASIYVRENVSREEITEVINYFSVNIVDQVMSLIYGVPELIKEREEPIQDSDFLRENLNTMIDSIYGKKMVNESNRISNRFSNAKFSTIRKDIKHTNKRRETIKKRECAIALNESLVPATKEEICKSMVTYSTSNLINEYYLLGIDISRIMYEANLSKNEIKRVVRESFHLYELRNPNCRYNRKEQEEAIDLSIRQIASFALFKKSEQLYKSVKPKDESKELQMAHKEIRLLEEKNDSLLRKINKPKEKQKDNSKEFMAEISQLRKELREKEDEILNLTSEIKEIKLIVEEDEVEIIEENHIDELKEYLKSHKVLVWGLRDEDEQKLSSIFPELRFVSSDSRLNRKQLAPYDAVIMGTSYTNHGSFWHTRDFLKNANIPFAYMKKNDHSPESLARAWNIAIMN